MPHPPAPPARRLPLAVAAVSAAATVALYVFVIRTDEDRIRDALETLREDLQAGDGPAVAEHFSDDVALDGLGYDPSSVTIRAAARQQVPRFEDTRALLRAESIQLHPDTTPPTATVTVRFEASGRDLLSGKRVSLHDVEPLRGRTTWTLTWVEVGWNDWRIKTIAP